MDKIIIFDMDGVISDTMNLHTQTEEKLLRQYGIRMTADLIKKKYSGIPTKVVIREIFQNHHKSVNLHDFLNKKWKIMKLSIKKSLLPIPGIFSLINKFRTSNYRLAVASSSPREIIKLILDQLNITDNFAVITSVEEIKKAKPNPEIFLLTAKKLKASPQQCLVIEDAVNGMIAAKKAGMKCIGLVEDIKRTYPCDLKVTSLTQLSMEKINLLFETN